jgi:hypothetical protein
MPSSMSSPRSAFPAVLAIAAALGLGACGSSGGQKSSAPTPSSASGAEQFPSAKGKTIEELVSGLPEGPILAPASSVLNRGTNRFGFTFFDRARKQLTGAEAAIYTSPLQGGPARGPYLAHDESLTVAAPFRSQTAAQDPDAAKSVYVSKVWFGRRGPQRIVALARLDGRLVASSPFSVSVGPKNQPPKIGQKAIRVHTPTVASVHGDISKIDTRVPPDPNLHEVDLYDVLGHKPVVLAFATPALCVSRVCGPVVDIVAQMQAKFGSKVAFIHQEIYNDNQINKGFRPQVAAWRLPSEPWVFVIDRHGTITGRFESAFSASELQKAIERMLARS